MHLFIPMMAEIPGLLTGVLSVVAAMAISFTAILLIASHYRFQHIMEQAEDTDPEEMGVSASDVLRVQLARFVTGCSRRGTSFSLTLIRAGGQRARLRMDSPFIRLLKQETRRDDVCCVFDDRTAALLTENDPEDSLHIITRIAERAADRSGPAAARLLAGIASFPGHGSTGSDLLRTAVAALAEAEDGRPFVMPEVVDPDEEEADDEEDAAAEADAGDADSDSGEENGTSWTRRRKTSMLDELTGVLKPSAVSSYMQRMMNDIRQKKKKAALFCIGINNLEFIERFHGAQAIDDILMAVSKILQEHVRATDLIGRHEKHAFLVLAQVPLADAEKIGHRISTEVQHAEIRSGSRKLKTTITLGVAAYPEHGRNLHQLYKAGQKVLDYNRKNDIRAYAVYDPSIHDMVPSKPMKSIRSIEV